MRSGEKFTVKQNFSGLLRESYLLSSDEGINQKNRELIKLYWKSGFGLGVESMEGTPKGWHISNVSSETVEKFLLSFMVHSAFVDQRNAHARFLSKISEKYPCCDILLISPGEGGNAETFDLGKQDRKSASFASGRWRLRKDRVASRGDEKLGLSEEQKIQAQRSSEGNNKQPSDIHYRTVRNKPLLMIHLLNLGEGETRQFSVPAYGISFPPGNYSESIDVVANRIWVEQIHGGIFDEPDEEDDYDE
jgi:hypothetical protein